MVITETIEINGTKYIHNYSDKGMMIERDGIQYEEAVDPVNSCRKYIETDIPIIADDPEEEMME